MNASSSDHQTGWTSNQERTFSSVDAEGDYTYYKIQFTQAEGTDSYLGFREIDLIGVDYTPVPDFNLALTLDENNATFKAAGFRHSICRPNGEDLRFQTLSGTELKYEIISWNQSGKSLVWVQVPSLARNDKIIMRWGNTDAAAPAYVTNGDAWSSDYLALYHLEQAQDAAANDATSRGNDAGLVNAQYPPTKSNSGIFGGGYLFPRNTGRAFVEESISGTLGLDSFSVSTWLMAEYNDAQDWQNYWAIKTAAGGFLRLEANNQNPPRLGVFGNSIVNPNMYSTNSAAGKMNADEWNHVVVTGSGGKIKIYVNGTKHAETNFQESAQIAELFIGKGADRNSAGATLDEISFHTVARHERLDQCNPQQSGTG